MTRITKIIPYIYNQVYSKLNPTKYAKKIGVNFEIGDICLYGRINWSTEPWIIKLGKNVHITNNVTFVPHDGGTLLFRKYEPDLEITKPITIGNDVYIGTNSTILGGVNIGDKVVIGACSVVTRDIPSNSVAVGNPARVIKSADEYFEKLKKESIHLGDLKGKAKEDALKKYFNVSQ
jgi:acetyltransferase-like isoleucine patch superfamily enzyme